jgi:hypothetical protein
VAAAVVAVGAGMTTWASVPDASGVIHGCYQPSTGTLTIRDSATTPKCPAGTNKINWNQAGPQGPSGGPGPTGPKGPTGPTGPAGLAAGYVGYGGRILFPGGDQQTQAVVAVHTPPVPAGSYLVTASIVNASVGDLVDCWIGNIETEYTGVSGDQGDWQTLTLTDVITVSGDGHQIAIKCADTDGGGGEVKTQIRNSQITAIPVASRHA